MSENFIHGHLQFRREYFNEAEWLRKLARDGQSPHALYIGCSDSRVVPELLTSAKAGDLFVVRNIANFVPPRDHPDASVGAAIDYALGALKVRDVIVCGHTGCGGVKAAMAGADNLPPLMPELRQWVADIERGVAHVRDLGLTHEQAARRAEEENVLASLAHLAGFESVAARLQAGDLTLHGWLYDLHSLTLSVYDDERDGFVDASQIVAL